VLPRIYFFVFVILVFLSCDNDDETYFNIPSVVQNAFLAEFPNSTDIKIRKSGENYEVDFEVDGKNARAFIAPEGNILREKKEVSLKALPPEIKDSLKKFGENRIKDPELIKSGNEIYYQAQIKRFFLNKKIVLDQSGREDTAMKYWK